MTSTPKATIKVVSKSSIPMIRCTQQEREEIEQKAELSGMTLTEYILVCALVKELPTPVPDLNIDGYALLQQVLEQIEQLQGVGISDPCDNGVDTRLNEITQSIRQLRRDLIGLPSAELEMQQEDN
jgi:hypothetical protein